MIKCHFGPTMDVFFEKIHLLNATPLTITGVLMIPAFLLSYLCYLEMIKKSTLFPLFILLPEMLYLSFLYICFYRYNTGEPGWVWGGLTGIGFLGFFIILTMLFFYFIPLACFHPEQPKSMDRD